MVEKLSAHDGQNHAFIRAWKPKEALLSIDKMGICIMKKLPLKVQEISSSWWRAFKSMIVAVFKSNILLKTLMLPRLTVFHMIVNHRAKPCLVRRYDSNFLKYDSNFRVYDSNFCYHIVISVQLQTTYHSQKLSYPPELKPYSSPAQALLKPCSSPTCAILKPKLSST